MINILSEALNKKVRILNEIMELCLEQENCLKTETPNVDRFSECIDEKVSLSKEIEKIDEGFISVYERVKEDLEQNKDTYAEEIRSIKQLIKTVSERTNSIRVKEDRLSADFKTKVSAGTISGIRPGVGRSSVAQKYAQTMQGSSAGAGGATFINKMQ